MLGDDESLYAIRGKLHVGRPKADGEIDGALLGDVGEPFEISKTELDKLGGETVLADPHRIYITGPSKLHATELVCPPALRPATILLIAMLGAEGTSILRNIYSINRGYEKLVERLTALGAKVDYLEEF